MSEWARERWDPYLRALSDKIRTSSIEGLRAGIRAAELGAEISGREPSRAASENPLIDAMYRDWAWAVISMKTAGRFGRLDTAPWQQQLDRIKLTSPDAPSALAALLAVVEAAAEREALAARWREVLGTQRDSAIQDSEDRDLAQVVAALQGLEGSARRYGQSVHGQ